MASQAPRLIKVGDEYINLDNVARILVTRREAAGGPQAVVRFIFVGGRAAEYTGRRAEELVRWLDAQAVVRLDPAP